MPKPKKKPAVKPEIRRQWLKRSEEDGETPPQIAKADGYDPRTVRKQIELARQDRERREARSMVYRQALEHHYADLVSFAERLDSEISGPRVSLASKQDRLWKVLRQHIPRSSLWRAIDKLDQITSDIEAIDKPLEQKLREKVEAGIILNFGLESDEVRLIPEGITGAIIDSIKVPEGKVSPGLRTNRLREGELEVTYGSWNCATAPDDQAPTIHKFISDLMSEAYTLPDSEEIRGKLQKRHGVVEEIREELATIRLKRIVPGRCKYCPI